MAQAKKSKTVKAKPAKTARKAVRKIPAPITTGTQPRSGTKQALLIEMLSRDTGATIADITSKADSG